jgi:hypothetical protein
MIHSNFNPPQGLNLLLSGPKNLGIRASKRHQPTDRSLSIFSISYSSKYYLQDTTCQLDIYEDCVRFGRVLRVSSKQKHVGRYLVE